MAYPKGPNIAIVGLEDGGLGVRSDVDLPDLEEDMVLVRTRAVALNPIDSKMVGKLGIPGAVAGMDFAGEVLAIGSQAQTPVPLKVGDHVCGAVPGMHSLTPRVGAFATVVGATDINTLKIPDEMTFEQAASLGSGVGTIGLALYKSLDVPSGLNPIPTSSPHNLDLVKSYGATQVFDYRSPTCVQDNKKHTRNSLKYVLDCVSEPETMQFCYACLGRAGGRYTALEPYPEFLHTRPKTVQPDWVVGPVVLGKALGWPAPFNKDADDEARRFGMEWFKTIQQLLDEGRLRTHPLRLMSGGLEGALDGLDMLKKKQISGQKLIYGLTQKEHILVQSHFANWLGLLISLRVWLLALFPVSK